MEAHYRQARQKLGILMRDDGEPEGGAWNYDAENRKTVRDWKKDGAPKPPTAITRKRNQSPVAAEVEQWFPEDPGRAEDCWLPTTREGAVEALREFIETRLPLFGDYQDLMLQDSPTMFHSLIAAPLNLGLLLPMECVAAAERAYKSGRAPLAAVEGFVRQIIGWREFVNGVYWLKMPDYLQSNGLTATRKLPAFFYSGETDMNCLRCVIREVKDTAYNHHIQRLMILGNFLLLAGISPQEAHDWFLEMYIDAHEWVMAANVLGMALHADGGFMATKPYAGSAAYISKMSNYCSGCSFDPNKKSGPGACPFNLLYWDFYDRHADRFASNPRTSMMVSAWRKRPEAERETIRREAAKFLAGLT
jgi:deoxyribodipyrimidine photolyase-related protein